MNVGILVHGPHLQAKEWENLAWGTPPLMMGRIPKAIQMYFKLGARVIFFGTGASERDGVKEGQYMFNTLLEKKNELGKFEALKGFQRLGGLDVSFTPNGAVLYSETQAEVVIDVQSQNTKEELLAAGDAFLARGVTDVVLVSSANHMARCLEVAQQIYNDPQYEGKYKVLAQGLMVTPADTCYAGATYGSNVIFEAPHRGDRSSYPLHDIVRQIFAIKPENLPSFGDDLTDLVVRYVA